MKNRSKVGLALAVAMGLAVFLTFQVRMPDGKIKVGASLGEAEACTDNVECFPEVEFVDLTGGVWNRESLRGKIAVVNFWATWCAPCRAEIPELTRFYQAYKDKGVILLGLLRDQPSDAALASFSEQAGLDYPVVRADGDIAVAFGYPEALPTTFVYDRNGHVIEERRGAVDFKTLEELIKPHL